MHMLYKKIDYIKGEPLKGFSKVVVVATLLVLSSCQKMHLSVSEGEKNDPNNLPATSRREGITEMIQCTDQIIFQETAELQLIANNLTILFKDLQMIADALHQHISTGDRLAEYRKIMWHRNWWKEKARSLSRYIITCAKTTMKQKWPELATLLLWLPIHLYIVPYYFPFPNVSEKEILDKLCIPVTNVDWGDLHLTQGISAFLSFFKRPSNFSTQHAMDELNDLDTMMTWSTNAENFKLIASSCPLECFGHYLQEGCLTKLDFVLNFCTPKPGMDAIMVKHQLSNNDFSNALERCQASLAELDEHIAVSHAFPKDNLVECFDFFRKSKIRYTNNQLIWQQTLSSGSLISIELLMHMIHYIPIQRIGVGLYNYIRYKNRSRSMLSNQIQDDFNRIKELAHNIGDSMEGYITSRLLSELEQLSQRLASLLEDSGLNRYSYKVSEAEEHVNMLEEDIQQWKQSIRGIKGQQKEDYKVLLEKMDEIGSGFNQLLQKISRDRNMIPLNVLNM